MWLTSKVGTANFNSKGSKNVNNKILVTILLGGILVGCGSTPERELTPMQIQAFQTHEFESSKSTAFNSILSVFQDLGYIVDSADKSTGFITASSAAENKTGFWQAAGGTTSSGKTKATAFVEEIRPGLSRIRLNFVDTRNLSSAYGQESQEDTPILDPKPYQVAFDKVGTAVFVRQGTIK